MEKLLSLMEDFKSSFIDKENLKKLVSFYNNKFYVYVLSKQYNRLVVNMRSIAALIAIDNIEDAYTIFRKYLETYSIIMSVYENKSVVDAYMMHDSYVGAKACGKNKDEIKAFITNKPDGFLEYGYLNSVVDTSEFNFKYTMKTVCKAALLDEYYGWYKQCNNFVHNNLSSVKINIDEGKNKLIEKCFKSFNHLKNKIEKIIN